jgi:endonuclease/exonuclease/phosphatase family metal-dependent hydrolase
MGDFNFRPDTDQYALTTQHLDEAWLAANHQTVIPEGFDISRRIDYIYISPEIRVSEAQYLGRGPSDHPAFFAEIVW